MTDLLPDLLYFALGCLAIIVITVVLMLMDIESQKAQDQVNKMKLDREERLTRMMSNER